MVSNSTLYNCNRNPEIVTKPSATASASSESTTILLMKADTKKTKIGFGLMVFLTKVPVKSFLLL